MIDINELRRRIDWGYKVANGVISELLDHLEKAESDALEEARLNGMGAERELALMAKLEAAEKEIALKERVIDALGSELNAVANERDALQAKVNEMEQQEPIGEVVHNGESAGLYDILEQGTPLYALPGAKGE